MKERACERVKERVCIVLKGKGGHCTCSWASMQREGEVSSFWSAMGATRAPVFAWFMEQRLPTEISEVIFRLARTSDRPYVQWKRPPTSARVFKPNGQVTDLAVGDFITTLYPSEFCFRIDEWRGDETADGPICFRYSVVDMKRRVFIAHDFSLKMGTTRHIICHPFGIEKYGNHLSNDAWSSIVRIDDHQPVDWTSI